MASASWATVAALLGGTLAATSHVAKATTRAAVNTSPEPFSNIALSLAGDDAGKRCYMLDCLQRARRDGVRRRDLPAWLEHEAARYEPRA